MQTNLATDKKEQSIGEKNRHVQNKSAQKKAGVGQADRNVDVNKLIHLVLNNPNAVTHKEFMALQKIIGYPKAMKLLEEGRRRKLEKGDKKVPDKNVLATEKKKVAEKATVVQKLNSKDASTKKSGTKPIQLKKDETKVGTTSTHEDSGKQTKKYTKKPAEANVSDKTPDVDSVLDVVQTALDIVGFVPGMGDIADGVNTGICIARNDWIGAVFSAISLIPVVGSVVAAPLKTIFRAAGNIKLIENALSILSGILGNAGKVAAKLGDFSKNIKEILRGLPGLINSIADNKAVEFAIGSKGIKAIRSFIKMIKSGITVLVQKVDEVFSSIKKAILKKADKFIDEAALARRWQGGADYPGIDNWVNIKIKKGTKIWGGAPGQSNFYTTEDVMQAVGTDATKLYQGLQVGKGVHPKFRPGMTQYEVVEDINVGYAKALANKQYGEGGFEQYFVSNYESVLRPIQSRIMKNR